MSFSIPLTAGNRDALEPGEISSGRSLPDKLHDGHRRLYQRPLSTLVRGEGGDCSGQYTDPPPQEPGIAVESRSAANGRRVRQRTHLWRVIAEVVHVSLRSNRPPKVGFLFL